MHVVSNNGPSIEDLGTGRDERCNNRFCRGRFPFVDGTPAPPIVEVHEPASVSGSIRLP
jgi:hypothetical protein